MEQKGKIKNLLTAYLRRLTNLSGNNRSLFLPGLRSDQLIDLHTLSQLNKEKSFSIIEALIAQKKKIICPVLDARMEVANEVSKKLKKLQRLDHFLFEERGSKDLHIGWPFVRGKFIDGTAVQCPLLFFPVEIVIENNQWIIQCRQDTEVSFNKSFLLGYSFYNKISVDEALMEENFEEVDRDSTVFRTSIYQFLQKANIEIHFNAENYRDELSSYSEFKKQEFENQHKNGELKLFPEAVLGIFPQAGSYLVPDYVDLIKNEKINDLEEFFLQRSQLEVNSAIKPLNFIHRVKEDKVYSAFPMDVWQENSLKAVKLGNSIVVQGPPGTGKSQLICNLICDGVAAGKRILVVCQKRAALDVVYKRLLSLQLTPFIGLVHDFKNDRKDIYDKIASQIDRVDEYRSKNKSLDAIQLERKFLQVSHRIDQIAEDLEEFKHALFDESEAGISVKELYLRSTSSAEVINLKQEFQHFKMDTIDVFLAKLKSLNHYATRFEDRNYEWFERKPFSSYGLSEMKSLQSLLREVPSYAQAIFQKLKDQLNAELSWSECEALLEKKNAVEEIMQLIGEESRFPYFSQMILEPEEETSSLWLSNIERVVAACYADEGPELSVPLSQLGQFQEALRRSMKARKSLFGLIRWELFSRDKYLIQRTLVGNGLKNDKTGFRKLEQKLDSRLNLEHNLSKLKSKKWLLSVPDSYQLSAIQHWFQDQHRAIHAKIVFGTIRGLKNIVDPQKISWTEFSSRLESLYKILGPIEQDKTAWLRYLTVAQIQSIWSNHDMADQLLQILRTDFDKLVEYDKLKEALTSDERNIIAKLNEVSQANGESSIQPLFLNSLCLAWIEHIELKFPVLRMVSSGKLGLLESEFRELLVEKQKISNEILLLRARENVTADLEFNRLNNRVTYRDLYHQVIKKKRVWPVRKVIQEFKDELFQLIPCWLASPESVSAMFPMEEMFDLVIFDEASQCFTERGIPAMYRGKQVVVAGDNQQLRPSDLYQVRWQEEDKEDPDLEAESLLELCDRYLMKTDLRSHYRSKSMPLIDFSNQHFYQGRLKLLPDRNAINLHEPPIQYLKLEGCWENNANKIEADEIVRMVMDLIRKDPKKEIGIVTFNAQQQMLILDLLEEKASAEQVSLPETLFVKNIENVQGDEKDIIIFSIGYAPDTKGKLSVQFGSLNQVGGENRLNVAITRAREKIIVVTSIWPDELHTEDTKNEGPKLLKKYLQYARGVSQGKFTPYKGSIPGHSANWYLKAKVKQWGDKMYPLFPVSADSLPLYDLTVQAGEFYQGVILTDDELYYQSISVKDRHAYIPALLEEKNWKYLAIYSRNAWQDPDKFFNEVAKFVTQ